MLALLVAAAEQTGSTPPQLLAVGVGAGAEAAPRETRSRREWLAARWSQTPCRCHHQESLPWKPR